MISSVLVGGPDEVPIAASAAAGLYTLVSEDEVEYLYCERCAKVTTVTPAQLDSVRKRIHREFGFTARFAHFPIVGLCEDCAADR